MAVYGRAKIREYWVIDLQGSRLAVHQRPTGEDYQFIRSFTEGLIQPLLLDINGLCIEAEKKWSFR